MNMIYYTLKIVIRKESGINFHYSPKKVAFAREKNYNITEYAHLKGVLGN